MSGWRVKYDGVCSRCGASLLAREPAVYDRATRTIHHIVVAPAGVFVVDAKRYHGRIELRNRGWFLRPDHRLCVGGRDRSDLADNMAWQVAAVEAALRAAGLDPLPPIIPVLCFIDGEWPLIAPPDAFRGVLIEDPNSLRRRLSGTAVIDASEIERLVQVLAAGLPPK